MMMVIMIMMLMTMMRLRYRVEDVKQRHADVECGRCRIVANWSCALVVRSAVQQSLFNAVLV